MKITGQTLINPGYQPGRWFGEALDYANRHQLQGDALKAYLDSVAQGTIIQALSCAPTRFV